VYIHVKLISYFF